jgi:hypothetical protein
MSYLFFVPYFPVLKSAWSRAKRGASNHYSGIASDKLPLILKDSYRHE